MKTLLYYDGKLVLTIVHPRSTTDAKKAVAETKD